METEKPGVGVEENTEDSEDILRDIRLTTVMIVLNLALTALCCWLAVTIIDHTLTGVIVGIIVWALILFKTPVWDWCFINVKPNWVVILANQTVYDVVPSTLSDRTDVEKFPLRSMREVGPGIRGRLPWEFKNAELNLESEILLGNKISGKPLRCVTSDEIEVFIVWQVIVTLLRGYSVNFIRQDEKTVLDFISGEFEQAILTWVKQRKEETIAADVSQLHLHFKHVLGGPDKVSNEERKNGIFTNTPQISSYERNEAFQKAAQAEIIARKMRESLNTINNSFLGEKPNPNVVLATAASLAGNPVEGILIISGLEGVDPDSVAGLVGAMGKTQQNKKKGKK